MTNPSWFPSSLRVKFWFLWGLTRFLMTCPCGLSASSPSTPLPSPPQLQPPWSWALLKHIFSSLCSKPPYYRGFLWLLHLPYPHHSLSTKHLSPPGMGFSRLYCLSTSYKAYYLINFLFCCFPTPRDMFYWGKSISIWWIFVMGMNFPFHPHAKCTIIEETGFNKTPIKSIWWWGLFI